MDRTLRRLERVLTAGVAGGEDIEEAARVFVSELFDFVVQGLNKGGGKAVTIHDMEMKYSAMEKTIRDVDKATAVKSSAVSQFYPRFRKFKMGWQGDPDSFDAMIQAMLKRKIDSEYSKMNTLVAECMKANDCQSRTTYKNIIESIAMNNAKFRFFLQKDVLLTIMQAHLKPRIERIVNNCLFWYKEGIEQHKGCSADDATIGKYIATKIRHNKLDFLTLIASLRRMAKCSDNRGIDVFFGFSNENVEAQKPLIRSIMINWLWEKLNDDLISKYGNMANVLNFIRKIERLCTAISMEAYHMEDAGMSETEVVEATRVNFESWYKKDKTEFTASGDSVEVFERAFELYLSFHTDWNFYERLIETGPMSITH